MRVRQTSDLATVLRLDRVILPSDVPIDTTRGAWWLAWSGATPVGFAGARVLTAERWVLLERAGVLPSHRGRGLHRRLVRARVAWARRQGVRGVLTYTTADNGPSANTLIAAGFRVYAPQSPWAGTEFVYWQKDLCGASGD